MKKDTEISLLIILICIFSISILLNIGLLTKHIIIKDANCIETKEG